MNTIQSNWLEQLRDYPPEPLTADEIAKAREQFYAGSVAMLESILKLDPDTTSDNAFHHIMEGYGAEAQAFKREREVFREPKENR